MIERIRAEHPRATLLLAVAAGLTIAVLGGVGLALLTGVRGTALDAPTHAPEPSIGSASPSIASESEPPTDAPVPSAAATAEPSPESTPSATATPDAGSGSIVRWAQTAAFAADGSRAAVRDLAYAAGHFIAIGYVGPSPDDPYPARDGAPRLWISTDGRSWEQIDPGPSFSAADPRSIAALPDGSAIVYGFAVDASSSSVAWRSSDGRSWTDVELSLPRFDWISDVAAGPTGLVTATSTTTETEDTIEVWHSEDGATWRVVHVVRTVDGFRPYLQDWAAGPEGFVILAARGRSVDDQREERSFFLASGDGVTWFEATESGATNGMRNVAPVRGDWIVTVSPLWEQDAGSDVTIAYASANGLAWQQVGSFAVPMPESPDPGLDTDPFIGELVSTGERVIASGDVGRCCHGPWWASGVWSSFDGRSWERLGFPAGTVITAAAAHDGIVVLAGFDRAVPDHDHRTRAVFWIGEREP